jgi:hypothetical protein
MIFSINVEITWGVLKKGKAGEEKNGKLKEKKWWEIWR